MRKVGVVAASVTLGLVGVATSEAQSTSTSTTTSTTTVQRSCVAAFTPDVAHVGDEVTLTLSGFDPNESITAFYLDEDLGSQSADATGAYSEDLGPIPDEAVGGEIVWDFLGETSGATCSASLTVIVENAPADPDPSVADDPGPTQAVQATPAFTG
jgi:hypothetical protein